MNKRKEQLQFNLDDYEKEIEDGLPILSKALKPAKDAESEKAIARAAAANYLRKDSKINIRLTTHDLDGIRRLAAREGLPYQTLISSILHKYVAQHI